MRLMIVDDDDLVAALLATKLSVEGFAVSLPQSAAAALLEVADTPPDILLLDIHMPGLDGMGFLKALRSSAFGASTRVLMMTAEKDEQFLRAAREGGAVGYLLKPLEISALIQTVRRIAWDPTLRWIDDRSAVQGEDLSNKLAALVKPCAKALIVESVEVNRELFSLFLMGQGFAVEAVGDGETALQRVSKENYDVIFMDMRLPGLTGTEVIRSIRERGLTVPILATGLRALENDMDTAMSAGANDFLPKPFTKAALRLALDRLLIARRAAA